MVLASNNKGKQREIKEILDKNIKLLSDLNINVDVVEDGNTFYENAAKKAHEIYDICKEEVIADDSGLIVDALGDFPGVHTARFLGPVASDNDRNNYLIDQVKDKDKSCHIECVIVYYDGEKEISTTGTLRGKIVSPRGENGFGFDSIVELDNGKTLAELSSDEKNKVSARFLALNELKKKLEAEIEV